ncbi:MAG: hypothetical protein ACREE5_00270, partial [Acetobacteraceae bacterium]
MAATDSVFILTGRRRYSAWRDEAIIARAAALVRARQSGRHIEALPVTPSSAIDVHAIQDYVAALPGEAIGGFLDISRIRLALRVNGGPVLQRHGGHPIEDPLTVAVT